MAPFPRVQPPEKPNGNPNRGFRPSGQGRSPSAGSLESRKTLGKCGEEIGSSGRTRTYNPPVNSRMGITEPDEAGILTASVRYLSSHNLAPGKTRVIDAARGAHFLLPLAAIAAVAMSRIVVVVLLLARPDPHLHGARRRRRQACPVPPARAMTILRWPRWDRPRP